MVTEQKTAPSIILERGINAVFNMNTAITYLRVFPPTSATTENFIDMAYESLCELLKAQDSIVFAETERDLIISGHSVGEKEMKKPQVVGFLDLFLKLEIRSITFQLGLEKDELREFLTILSNTPEELERDGGIQQVMASKGLPHILLNKKIYITADRDSVVSRGTDLDQDIIKYLKDIGPSSDIVVERFKEMAKDPKWLSKVLKIGIKSLVQPTYGMADEKLSNILVRMITISEGIEDQAAKRSYLQQLVNHLTELDGKVISMVLTQGLDSAFGDASIYRVLDSLDDDKFQILVAKIRHERNRLAEEEAVPHSSLFQPIDRLHEDIMSSERGKKFRRRIEERVERERENIEKKIAHVRAGVSRILKGDQKAFSDQRLMEFLPSVAKQAVSKDKGQIAQAIIDQLTCGLSSKSTDVRDLVSEALSRTLDALLPEQRLDTVHRIAGQLIGWIRDENVLTPSYRLICSQLQRLAQSFLDRREFSEAVPIIEAFSSIHSGKISKIEPIQILSTEVMNSITSAETMNSLLNELRTNEQNKRKDAFSILVLIGHVSIDPLLDILSESRSMPERKRILQLILEIGDTAIPALTERIKQGGPWYYLRNLAFLLGRMGNEAHLNVLQTLIQHDDVRVQRETLNSIYKIGGDQRSEVLLSALQMVDDRMKPQIVELLGTIRSRDAVKPLLDLLSSKSFLPSEARNELEEKTCIALGRIGSQDAIPALTSIVAQKGFLSIRPYSAEVKSAAENALIMIRKKQSQVEEPKSLDEVDTRTAAVSESKATEREEQAEEDFSRGEELVDRYVKEGNRQAAVKLLYDLIIKFARGKDFSKAESLKEKLFEVNPMALTEIIRANEIIEEEKSGAIDQDHLKIWSRLYDSLSTEEANTLYYAMEEVEYDIDQPIFEQGDSNPHLYFINQGRLKMVYGRDDREILLKTLGRGDMVGGDAFFSDTVCTTSVITLSRVKLNLLRRDVLRTWKDEFPSLISKLNDYYLKFENVQDLLKKKELDRRSEKRVKISGRGLIQLLGAAEKPIGGTFRGSFTDISAGGLSFVVKISNSETARLLLGRYLNIKFLFPSEEAPEKMDRNGTVVGIWPHPFFEEYSIHVKFDKLLSETDVEDMKRLSESVQ